MAKSGRKLSRAVRIKLAPYSRLRLTRAAIGLGNVSGRGNLVSAQAKRVIVAALQRLAAMSLALCAAPSCAGDGTRANSPAHTPLANQIMRDERPQAISEPRKSTLVGTAFVDTDGGGRDRRRGAGGRTLPGFNPARADKHTVRDVRSQSGSGRPSGSQSAPSLAVRDPLTVKWYTVSHDRDSNLRCPKGFAEQLSCKPFAAGMESHEGLGAIVQIPVRTVGLDGQRGCGEPLCYETESDKRIMLGGFISNSKNTKMGALFVGSKLIGILMDRRETGHIQPMANVLDMYCNEFCNSLDRKGYAAFQQRLRKLISSRRG